MKFAFLEEIAKTMQSFIALVVLLTASCANESAEYCEASRELDFSIAGLPPGSWVCPFGASAEIDAAGKPRRVAPNPVREYTFGCSSQTSLPLVLRDPNVQSDFGDARELVESEVQAGYVKLTYHFDYHGGDTTIWRYYFRVEKDGMLSYARSNTSDIYWQFCVDHQVPGKTLGTSKDDSFTGTDETNDQLSD